jgi:hypothetical protein
MRSVLQFPMPRILPDAAPEDPPYTGTYVWGRRDLRRKRGRSGTLLAGHSGIDSLSLTRAASPVCKPLCARILGKRLAEGLSPLTARRLYP